MAKIIVMALSVPAFILGVHGACAAATQSKIVLTTYLRDGPGIRYRVVDEIQTATAVSVLECANGWCHVLEGSIAGYVRARELAAGSDVTAGPAKPSCFVDGQASYHGSRDVQFCRSRAASAGSPAAARP